MAAFVSIIQRRKFMLIPSWSKAQKEAFRTHHPTKYPIKQVKHNYPKANVKEFADLIFAADCPEYKGLVTIVRRPKGTSTMGKDQFLKILVAEMQYQDPLEPTTNTEWVSQLSLIHI